MLVANPGQAPYSIIVKKPCSNNSARNNATVSSTSRFNPPSSATIAPSNSNLISKTMTAVAAIPTSNEQNSIKSLSVRITREADLFKKSVQSTTPSKFSSHHISVLSLYTVPPTNIHRYPERLGTRSVDSLQSEMCHFKPIRTVPTTPAKRSKAPILKIPQARLAKKEQLMYNEPEGPRPSMNLKERIDNSGMHETAFSLVALPCSNVSQQHKKQNTSSDSHKNKNEKKATTGKLCKLPKSDTNTIPHAGDSKCYGQFIHPTSVKHRTRRNTRTLPSTEVVEQQNNKTYSHTETRVTRKRQIQLERNDTVPLKKNAKLSEDCSKPIKNGRNRNATTGRLQPNRRTPPVTRSRLKQSMTHSRKQYQNK